MAYMPATLPTQQACDTSQQAFSLQQASVDDVHGAVGGGDVGGGDLRVVDEHAGIVDGSLELVDEQS